MKKALLVIGIVMIMAVGASAQAPKINLYVAGGMAMPMGPDEFKDYWKTGLSFGGGIGFQQSANMELKAMMFYNKFDFDVDGVLEQYGVTAADGFSVDGGEVTAFEVMGTFKYLIGLPEASARPYFLGSVGIVAMKAAEATISGGGETMTTPETTESKLAFGGGAGVDIKVGPTMALFGEVQYIYVSTEGEAMSYLPIRGGIKFALGN